MAEANFPDLEAARASWAEVVKSIDPAALRNERWFQGRGAVVRRVYPVDYAFLPWSDGEELAALNITAVETDAGTESYFFPLILLPERPGLPVLARFQLGGRPYVLAEASLSRRFHGALLAALDKAAAFPGFNGRFAFQATAHRTVRAVEILGGDNTNTVVRLGLDAACKLLRRLRPGPSRAVALSRALGDLPILPALHGHLAYANGGGETTLAVYQDYLPNQGSLWDTLVSGFTSFLSAAVAPGQTSDPGHLLTLWLADRETDLHRLARLLAVLHAALSKLEDTPAMADPAPIAARTAAYLDRSSATGPPVEPADLWSRAKGLAAHLAARTAATGGTGQRLHTHGDLHLGQILLTAEGYAVLDLEGEPLASEEEAAYYTTPLRDLAGLVRSLSYAGIASLLALKTAQRLTAEQETTAGFLAERFAERAAQTLIRIYLAEMASLAPGALPGDSLTLLNLLDLCQLERVAYEYLYEQAHRPAWTTIPLAGLKQLLSAHLRTGAPIQP